MNSQTHSETAVDIQSVLALHSVRLYYWIDYGDYEPTNKSIRSTDTDVINYPSSRIHPIERITANDMDDIYFITVEGLSGTSAVARSNREAFLELYDRPGVHTERFSGEDGGILIRLDVLTSEMVETIVSLEDYPVLDEEKHSEIESDERDDAWDNWVRREFEDKLKKMLSTDNLDLCVEGDLRPLFDKLMAQNNAEWIEESDGSYFIDLDRVCTGVTVRMLLDQPGVEIEGDITITLPETEEEDAPE